MNAGHSSSIAAGADFDRAATLAAGRAALGEARWTAALESLEAVDRFDRAAGAGVQVALSGADLDGLGEAAWWNGRLSDAIAFRERSVAAYIAEGDPVRAARVAVHLAADHIYRSESTIGNGWVRRAERLLTGQPLSAAHGWLERAYINQALARGDLARALEHADRVYEIGAQRQGR